MGKLDSTIINGDLVVAGDIIVNNNNNNTTNTSVYKVSYENKFSYNGTNFYHIPVVIWHGKINCQPSPSTFIYQTSGCLISVAFVSTGTYEITMNGSNVPLSNSDYQVVATGSGSTNQTSTPCFITCPYNYKLSNSFRLIVSDQYRLNKNGYCEISIIKIIGMWSET